MITWLRENAVLGSVLAALIAVISTVAVSRYQLSGLIAAQPEVQSHIHDTTRHIDPVRDGEEKKRLEQRIDQLERQIRWMQLRQGGEWQNRRHER